MHWRECTLNVIIILCFTTVDKFHSKINSNFRSTTKEALSVVYAENKSDQILNSRSYSRPITAHALTQLVLSIVIFYNLENGELINLSIIRRIWQFKYFSYV